MLQMKILKLGGFKIERESDLEIRQFGARAGNPDLYILLPLLAVWHKHLILVYYFTFCILAGIL